MKIFEHRRNFPDEPIMAYMYVSKPIKAIKGIVYLKRRHLISDWKKTYGKDDAALKRIVEYEKLYRYAMEISEFQETSEIPLEDFNSITAVTLYCLQISKYLSNVQILDE